MYSNLLPLMKTMLKYKLYNYINITGPGVTYNHFKNPNNMVFNTMIYMKYCTYFEITKKSSLF